MSDLSGKITDSSGKPLSGIQVTVMSNGTGQSTGLVATSGSDGTFDVIDYPFGNDQDKFLAFADPSGKYFSAVYPTVGFTVAELDPTNTTSVIGIPVLIGGIIALLIAGYFLFFYKKHK